MSATTRPEHVRAECLPGAGIDGVCDRCQSPLAARRRRWCSDECSDWYFSNHVFNVARHRARVRDNHRCVNGCERDGWNGVEVDHIEAARGLHGKHACVHHLDNLRSLCVPCHKARTAAQRRAAA